MVLQQERTKFDERPPTGKAVTWHKAIWPSLVAVLILAAMVFFVTYDRGSERAQESMPEYEVDTLANPEVAARTGGPIVVTDLYVGSSDANFDPDPPTWWMPEYEEDTALDPDGAAVTARPGVITGRYVGSSDADFDLDG